MGACGDTDTRPPCRPEPRPARGFVVLALNPTNNRKPVDVSARTGHSKCVAGDGGTHTRRN